MNNNIKRCTNKAKENWIGKQCSEIEENLSKKNSKRAYQLVKHLTTVKQGKATTVQDRSRKCLTEEREILNRWTEYCSELYNHKPNGVPSVLNCPDRHRGRQPHPSQNREGCGTIIEEEKNQLESTTFQQKWSKQVERS